MYVRKLVKIDRIDLLSFGFTFVIDRFFPLEARELISESQKFQAAFCPAKPRMNRATSRKALFVKGEGTFDEQKRGRTEEEECSIGNLQMKRNEAQRRRMGEN